MVLHWIISVTNGRWFVGCDMSGNISGCCYPAVTTSYFSGL